MPYAIDLRVIGRCNLRCAFCFGPRHELGSSELPAILRFLDRARDDGAEALVVTGGEPLLSSVTSELLRHAKSIGLLTTLSTNGTLLRRHADSILPWLDWIALPLDGPTASDHDRLRPGRPSFDAVLDAFAYTTLLYPEIRVKIGTVLQPGNVESLHRVPKSWPFDRPPDTWKVYEVSLSSYAHDNQVMLRLSENRRSQALDRCATEAETASWNFVAYRNEDRDGKYLFIEPDGSAMGIAGGQERVVGNFFTDYDNALDKVARLVDKSRLAANHQATYDDDRPKVTTNGICCASTSALSQGRTADR